MDQTIYNRWTTFEYLKNYSSEKLRNEECWENLGKGLLKRRLHTASWVLTLEDMVDGPRQLDIASLKIFVAKLIILFDSFFVLHSIKIKKKENSNNFNLPLLRIPLYFGSGTFSPLSLKFLLILSRMLQDSHQRNPVQSQVQSIYMILKRIASSCVPSIKFCINFSSKLLF